MARSTDVLKALLSDRVVGYHPKLAKLFGSVTAALMFCQLAYWDGVQPPERAGWFYKTRDDLSDETGMSLYEIDGARKVLCSLGVIEAERRGVPARLWYRVRWEALADLVESSFRKNLNQESEKPTNKPPENRDTISEITTKTTLDNALAEQPIGEPDDPDLAALRASTERMIGSLPRAGRRRTADEIKAGAAEAALRSMQSKPLDAALASPINLRRAIDDWLVHGFGPNFCAMNGAPQPESVIAGWSRAADEIVRAVWGGMPGAKLHDVLARAEEAAKVLFTSEDRALNPKAWLVAGGQAPQYADLFRAKADLLDAAARIRAGGSAPAPPPAASDPLSEERALARSVLTQNSRGQEKCRQLGVADEVIDAVERELGIGKYFDPADPRNRAPEESVAQLAEML